jgi:DNA (cytosine-5)-methyltransferase 1
MRSTIPVIDLFAGPGGLGEGFCSYLPEKRNNRAFRILLSVEKDANAHRTLELRSFFRQFVRQVPEDYYDYLRGTIKRNELFERHYVEAGRARREAMLAELGKDDEKIYRRIEQRLTEQGDRPWVLIGGPPCQAYSFVGRSKRKILSETDGRQVLYQEYLKIIARFRPAVFVMENVKGMLSSKARLDENAKPHIDGKQELIFQRIIRDLKKPVKAVRDAEADWPLAEGEDPEAVGYRVYSLVEAGTGPDQLQPADFIIRSEDYGIPQTRHRVILLGVRHDIPQRPHTITAHEDGEIAIEKVIDDLPPLRSRISRYLSRNRFKDSPDNWKAAIQGICQAEWLETYTPRIRAIQLKLFEDKVHPGQPDALRDAIRNTADAVLKDAETGGRYIAWKGSPEYAADWYLDDRFQGVCNHESREHMESDLHRYLFLANFAAVYSVSPTMKQFPKDLLPDHENVKDITDDEDVIFDDRFRVQVKGQPATTITSHISKDGHYNVHYNPLQCRSLSVREAARIQTFPDNYFFEGNKTKQYEQIGNAVPPLLARQIAEVVYDLLESAYGRNR